MLKNKDSENDKYLFIFLLGAVPFLFQALLYHGVEDRYLMNAFPSFFLILSYGVLKIGQIIKKYSKVTAIAVILLIFAFGAYQQIMYANSVMEAKKLSYLEVKEAGLWLKENSNPNDIIFTASVPQTTYYAEREAYNFVAPQMNETNFEQEIKKLKPSFLVLSAYEPHAEWAYTYPESHNSTLTAVKIFPENSNQPTLIIYRFSKSLL
jgi:hypothetical protein